MECPNTQIKEVKKRKGDRRGRKEENMKYEILKVTGGYVLLIDRAGGTRNDYRFNSKAQLNRRLKLAGIR